MNSVPVTVSWTDSRMSHIVTDSWHRRWVSINDHSGWSFTSRVDAEISQISNQEVLQQFKRNWHLQASFHILYYYIMYYYCTLNTMHIVLLNSMHYILYYKRCLHLYIVVVTNKNDHDFASRLLNQPRKREGDRLYGN